MCVRVCVRACVCVWHCTWFGYISKKPKNIYTKKKRTIVRKCCFFQMSKGSLATEWACTVQNLNRYNAQFNTTIVPWYWRTFCLAYKSLCKRLPLSTLWPNIVPIHIISYNGLLNVWPCNNSWYEWGLK